MERVQPKLVQEALAARQTRESVDQAKQAVGGVYGLLEGLVPKLPRKRTVNEAVHGLRYTDSSTFPIPAQDGQTVEFIVKRQEIYELPDAFIVDIPDLDYIAVITPSGGYVEAKDHNVAPFTMNTPTGSSRDRGPKWRRQMDMETLDDYRQLIDSLNGVEPVGRKEEKRYDDL